MKPRAASLSARAARRLVALAQRPLRVSGSRAAAQAIVVLGAPIGPTGQLSVAAAERIAVALELYRAGLAPIVCVVGGHMPRAQQGTPTEAEGMAAWLRRAGVPESALRVDRLSRSTRENATRAAHLLHPEGIRSVCLVTQPFHSRRAQLLFNRAGFDAWVAPIEGGASEHSPRRALRWVVREYGSWLLLALRSLRT